MRGGGGDGGGCGGGREYRPGPFLFKGGQRFLLGNCVLFAIQSSFSWQQLKHAKFSETKYIRLLKAEFSFVPQIRRPLHCMKRNGRCEFY